VDPDPTDNLATARRKSMGETGVFFLVSMDGFPVSPCGPDESAIPVRITGPRRVVFQCGDGDGRRRGQNEQGGKDVLHSGAVFVELSR